MSSGQAREASSAAPHHSPSLVLPPEPSLPPLLKLLPEPCPHPGPWKNCLPQNWSLVPKRLGTTGLGYHYFSYFTVFPLFLCPLTSLISNYLSLLFGTQGRPRRLKSFSANKNQETWRGFCTWEGPEGSCSVSKSGIKILNHIKGIRNVTYSFIITKLP